MKSKNIFLHINILFFLLIGTLNAQNVRVTLSVPPPYPIHIEDYVQFNNQAIVTLNNLTTMPIDVKLITRVEGDNGLTAEVSPDYTPNFPINLSGMQSKVISGSQLRSINGNIGENDIALEGGFDKTIMQTETLPEGNYTICIDAYDYNTGALLSQGAGNCATIVITNYDPPQIILPEEDEHIEIQTPQLVNFIWTPSGLPAYTQYKFEIVDMNLNNLENVNDAFGNISVMLHHQVQNLTAPNLQYGITMPPLTEGHQYAIRVTAYDPQNRISYKNNGKSPITSFHYGGNPLATNSDGLKPPPIDDFTSNPPNNDPPDPNQPIDPDYAEPCSPLECSPAEPIGPGVNSWQVGDEVQVGYFKMKITAAVYNGVNISGTGEIEAPMFNTWLKVNFNNLQINADGKVLGGGTIKGDYDNGINIPQNLKNLAGGITNVLGTDVQSVTDYIQAGQKFADLFDFNPIKLPFGMRTNVGGQEQIIAITAFELTSSGAKINAFMSLEMPDANNAVLALGAKEICLHPTGLSEGGLQKLFLVEDFNYAFGPKIDLILKADQNGETGTFVKWDCEGYEELQVEGEFVFDTQLLVPEDENGQVKAGFVMNMATWGELITQVDFDPFYVKGAKGLKFDFNQVTLDFSEVNNIPGMSFPSNYNGDQSDLWTGFYFDKIDVTLPNYLKKNNNSISISMDHAIIDKLGFTGKVSASPLLDLNDGIIGGWEFSIDEFMLEFINNSMTGSYFDGKVVMPIAETGLGYHCLLNNSNTELETEFQISNLSDLEVPMWVAELTIENGSTLTIAAQGNDVTTEANLSGGLTISGEFPDIPNLSVDIPDVEFQHLRVKNKQPYLSVEYFSMASPQKSFNGFEISIDPEKGEGISLDIEDNLAIIDFGFSIGIHNDGAGISGGTNFSIIGKLTNQQGKQKWKYDKTQLNKIYIDATLAALKIDGEIEFYNGDETFGKGFRGWIHAVFNPFVDVMATAQFGKVDDYRYWFVDAKATFKPGIPVGPALGIYGFGGGAYYHMEPDIQNYPPISDINTDNPKNQTEFDLDSSGESQSGVVYLPNKNIAFGLRATMVFGTVPDPLPVNADITFEANFNNNGGLNYIRFKGDGYVMTDVLDRENPKVHLALELKYWVPENKFHGLFEIDFNIYEILEGDGDIVIHSEPGEWYVLAGTPEQRMSIKALGLVEFGTYMMMGNNIPGPPPMPDKFNQDDLFGFELSRGEGGAQMESDPLSGFAFGQEIDFSTGELQFLIFYAKLEILMGYDVALLKGIQCDQISDPGINGWYGWGQAYAGFDFECGIKIDLWFLKADIEILSAYIYAAVEVGLPNPTWARGMVTGGYSVLNGLLEGSFTFHFEAGTVCEPPGINDPFGGIKVISDFSPKGEQEDVFVVPEVAFSVPLKTTIPVEGVNEDNKKTTALFRFFLDDIKVVKTGVYQNEEVISVPREVVNGQFEMVEGKLAQFIADDGLKASTEYTIIGKVHGERKVDGYWVKVTESEHSNKTYFELDSAKFITGKMPDKFVEKNIKVSHPRKMHRYFHYGDVGTGCIDFIHDIQDLFKTQPNKPDFYKYEYVVKFHKIQGGATVIAEVPMSYDEKNSAVYFDIPDDLQAETIYMAQFIARLIKNPSGWLQVNEGNKLSTVTEISNLGQGNTTEVKKTKINSTETEGNEYELYKYFFKTSKYWTWKSKWNSYVTKDIYKGDGELNQYRIHVEKEGGEPLDYYDYNASGYWVGSKWNLVPTLIGFENDRLDFKTSSGGMLWKIWYYYRDHVDWWINNTYKTGYLYKEWNLRNHPPLWDYGSNSYLMNNVPILENDHLAVGLKYIGNGRSNKLTNAEINKKYWQGFPHENDAPNKQGPQELSGGVGTGGGFPIGPQFNSNGGSNSGMGLNLQIVNLNNGGNGGNGPGMMPQNNMGFSTAPDYRLQLIYDHVRVTVQDREHYYTALMGHGPNGSGPVVSGKWHLFVENYYHKSFQLTKPDVKNTRYHYKWHNRYPVGISKFGLSGREESFKY